MKVGDQVFAKLSTFPHWPAALTSILGNSVNVQFSDLNGSVMIPNENLLPLTAKAARYILKVSKCKSGKKSRKTFVSVFWNFVMELHL